MRIIVSVIGKSKSDAFTELQQEYLKRLPWKVEIKEFEVKSGVSGNELKEKEGALLLSCISPRAVLFALDERGKAITSREFSGDIARQMEAAPELAFVIGGADGLSDAVKGRANALISFGAMTWPHKLVRVMLAEQLYRAYSISQNHPYHRD